MSDENKVEVSIIDTPPTPEGIILTPEQKKEDIERRSKAFMEEYKKLVEKYGIDFQAQVQPSMRLINLKP